MRKFWPQSTRRRSYWSLGAVALAATVALGLVAVSASASARPTKGAASARPTKKAANSTTVTTTVLASGTTTSSTGLDPNSSFCQFPSGAATVTTDPGYPSPTCAETLANPYVVSNAQATSNSWGAPISGSSWVGPNATGSSETPAAKCPAGNVPKGLQECNFYLYDATFTLPCLAKPSLKGAMMADNLAGVFLNGHFIKEQATGAGFSYDGVNPPGTNFTTPTAFTTSANFALTNTVDFVVWDSTGFSTGLDYKLVVTDGACGTLKICKVAGYGIPVGTPFTFTAGAKTVTVPAGPAPGGYCQVVGSAIVGTTGTITETIPTGDSVTGIGVAPPTQQVGSANLATGTVKVKLGTGVTEVTYTDQSAAAGQAGYLEICKDVPANGTVLPASFTFTVDGQTVTVPTNACSPAMQVPAGNTTVIETPVPGYEMTACSTIPAANLVSCSPGNNSAVVNVVPGGIANETILTVTNNLSPSPAG